MKELEILMSLAKGQTPCIFHIWTGLYCPGCGGTCAVRALLSGHPIISFLYHPLILYCTLVAAMFAGSCVIYFKTKNPRFRLYLENTYVYVGCGIIVLNFIVKNYLLVAKGIDMLALLPAV